MNIPDGEVINYGGEIIKLKWDEKSIGIDEDGEKREDNDRKRPINLGDNADSHAIPRFNIYFINFGFPQLRINGSLAGEG